MVKRLKAAVLMGGLSSERGVSFSSGRQILEGLDPVKYDAVGIDAAMITASKRKISTTEKKKVNEVASAEKYMLESGKLITLDKILDGSYKPDFAFLALHGKFGEDGTIQGLLELLGIPYTGSGVLASSLAMDKSMTKKTLKSDGINVPPSYDFDFVEDKYKSDEIYDFADAVGYPFIVKPSRQGSSIGMTKVLSKNNLENAVIFASKYDKLLVVEKFIEGIELTVGVLGNSEPFALPVIEIVPGSGLYDFESKYKQGATEEIVPARISDEATKLAQKISVDAHKSLGCSGASRVDIIYSKNEMYVLEINTIPGMTPTSLLPRAAEAAGIDFCKLLDMIVEFALEEALDL